MLRPLVCALALSVLFVPACSSEQAPAKRPQVAFQPEADFAAEGGFFAYPYPSDLRLTPSGAPDVTGFHDPGIPMLRDFKLAVAERRGFPTLAVGYFQFTEALAPLEPTRVLTGGAKEAIALVDVDPASPERGRTFPVVAETPNVDRYVPENLLAIAPRPGVVLAPHRKYAFVVTRALAFVSGHEAEAPAAFAATGAPGAGDERLRAHFAPLWETVDTLGLARSEVVAATVFTTGDVVADTAALGDKVLAAFTPDIVDLSVEPATSGADSALCHLRGTITLPQFQRGAPPYATEGLFEIGADGAPVRQRDETVPVSITVPKGPMPAEGYPLVVYFHGSGGVSRQLVDGGGNDEGDGGSVWPAEVLTAHGFAAAGAALPLSPERVPGASDYAYVNANNLVALRDTFRQGVLESRLLVSALERLRIPAGALATCAGAAETGEVRFAPGIHAQGQSMGGMYTNLVAATDPRIKLAVPTGAGGFWTYFLLETKVVANAGGLLSLLLKTTEKMSFLHPALHVGETAIEAADPIVSASRLGRHPLDGHPARPVYEPVGKDDSYFPTTIYDAMVLAYGHPRAGDEVWPSMREAQALVGLEQVASYPVRNNLTSTAGQTYTGVTVQYASDGTFDSHQIYRRIPAVMHQYGCFHESFRRTGTAVVSPPEARGAPCAE